MSEPAFVPILGRVPSGIYILSIRHQGQQTGMLASWVMQAGFDPPMVTVAVKQGRYVSDWIEAGSQFVLNVLGEDQKSMLGHFGRGFAQQEDAFKDIALSESETDIPVLKDSVGFLTCKFREKLSSGDHHIFLAQVTDGKLHDDVRPMVHIRKNGMNY